MAATAKSSKTNSQRMRGLGRTTPASSATTASALTHRIRHSDSEGDRECTLECSYVDASWENDDDGGETRRRMTPLSPDSHQAHNRGRRATVNGRVGTGRRGQRDGEIHTATLNRPFSVCALKDGNGTLAFTDMHNNAVRFVVERQSGGGLLLPATRVVQTMEHTELLAPKGICASEDGRYVFVCDTGHHKIKFASLPVNSALVSAEEILSGVEMFPFAGNGKKGWRDGPVLECSFNSPSSVWQCADGTIVAADTGNHCIRQIARTVKGPLVVRTIAGGYASYHIPGQERIPEKLSNLDDLRRLNKRNAGYRDGRRALFRSPSGIVEGPHGELLVADTMNNCVRGLLPSSDGKLPWETKTVCGVVGGGYTDGSCEIAEFSQPMSLCMGPQGTFFVSDRGNSCIRQVGGCRAQYSGRKSDSLSYSWVRTIEIGVVPQSVFEASIATLGECAVERLDYPLGVLFLNWTGPQSSRSPTSQPSRTVSDQTATLVVCDGGNNVIEFLSFDSNVNGVIGSNHNFELPCLSSQVEEAKTSILQPIQRTPDFGRISCLTNASPVVKRSASRRSTIELGSFSPVGLTSVGEKEDHSDNSDNQCPEEPQVECTCENASAWKQLLAANTALQTENIRLKELLHRTFEEIEFVNSAFECDGLPRQTGRHDNRNS